MSRRAVLASIPLTAAASVTRAARRTGRRMPVLAPSLERVVRGRVVLVTGASSGIGRATALKIGVAGGEMLLVRGGWTSCARFRGK